MEILPKYNINDKISMNISNEVYINYKGRITLKFL